jgi:hypothetical protein
MAILIKLADGDKGGPADAAYLRINSFYKDPAADVLVLSASIHDSQEARHSSQQPVDVVTLRCTQGVDIPNLADDYADVFANMYTWLKTLPRFAGAVDVIEAAPEPVPEEPVVDPNAPPVDPNVPVLDPVVVP